MNGDVYLFAYGTLRQKDDDPSALYSRYDCGQFLHEEAAGDLHNVASLYHVETQNFLGETITHPGLCFNIDPNIQSKVKGTLFKVKPPLTYGTTTNEQFRRLLEELEMHHGNNISYFDQELTRLISTMHTIEQCFMVLDFMERCNKPDDIYNPANYFYRSLVPIVADGKLYNAYTYLINPFSRRMEKYGGRSKLVSTVFSGDWLSYIGKRKKDEMPLAAL